MERHKKEQTVLLGAAELFDLPADLVAGLPHVELLGSQQFFMEQHRGILSYSSEEIAINTSDAVIRVVGSDLELVSMTADALRIRGTILQVEWVN